ncbi:MAG: HAD-IC family P-type ATPase [Armatimonadota bacterium]
MKNIPESEVKKETIFWHSLEINEVQELQKTDIVNGLTTEEAKRRLEEYGPNVVTRRKGKTALQMLMHQFTDPLVFILIIAAVIKLIKGDMIDFGVIMAVVIINAIIGFIQEGKAESAIASLDKMLTASATVIRDGEKITISSEEVVPGDIVIINSGDKTPADIRLFEVKNLHIDESILTGESAPVTKSTRTVHAEDPISEQHCMSFSGTLIARGSGAGIAIATGDDTQLGYISKLIDSAPEIATPLTKKLVKFGKMLSFAILIVTSIVFVISILMGNDPSEMFAAAVAIAVAMIPEGLPAIITIILAVGVRRMAARHAIIRKLPSVETLGSVSVICSDKTGTLTANEMTVKQVYAGAINYEFSGIGYDPRNSEVRAVEHDDESLHDRAFLECMICGVLCNDSDIKMEEEDIWRAVGDPTESALVTSAIKAGIDPKTIKEEYPRLDVIPFESEHMYMATLNQTPEGKKVIYVKGSLEKLLSMSSCQMFGDNLGELDKQHALDRADDFARQGYRVLAFAMKEVDSNTETIDEKDMYDLVYLGIQAMSDPARPEAIEAIKICKKAGIEVKMITGDHITTARAIARDLGLEMKENGSITGAELSKLSKEEFEEVANNATVFARVSPEQKFDLVTALQKRDKVIAMTGDGVNDAPALKAADIGVAMGKVGSEVAKDASDMVLTDDNFASIQAAVEEGRSVYNNLIKTLAYILPTNAGEGLVIISALLAGLTLPVTAIQILWINTVTTVTLSLSLAFEPIEKGLMNKPPRDPNAPMLSRAVIERILLIGIWMVIVGFAIFYYEYEIKKVSIEEARTAAVAAIVFVELFYLFSARSLTANFIKVGLFTNPYVWIGTFAVTLFQLAFTYLKPMNIMFGTAPISWEIWWHILILSLPTIVIADIHKIICRNYKNEY